MGGSHNPRPRAARQNWGLDGVGNWGKTGGGRNVPAGGGGGGGG